MDPIDQALADVRSEFATVQGLKATRTAKAQALVTAIAEDQHSQADLDAGKQRLATKLGVLTQLETSTFQVDQDPQPTPSQPSPAPQPQP